MFRGTLSRNGSAIYNGQPSSSGGTLTPAWTYCTGAPVFSSPIVHNGVVYIASTNGILTALDARSGHVLWKFQSGSQFYSTPSISNGILYIGALNGQVYAIDAVSGQERWHSPVDSAGAKIWSSPAVAGGLVIVGAASTLNEKPKIPGEVVAFDVATGVQRWHTWTMPDGAAGGGVWSSPAVDEHTGVVYVGTGDPDDGMQVLRLRDGHLIWHWRSVQRDVSDTDVGSGPLLYIDRQGQARVVVGGKDGMIYCLDAKNGNVIWHALVGEQVYSSPAYAQNTIYAVGALRGRAGEVWALDTVQGIVRWQRAVSLIVYASPVIANQALYVGVGNGFKSGDGGIQVIDPESGRLLQYEDLHSAVSSSPAVLPSWLFVGARDGNLYAFTR